LRVWPDEGLTGGREAEMETPEGLKWFLELGIKDEFVRDLPR
jgi:hypothetical protein